MAGGNGTGGGGRRASCCPRVTTHAPGSGLGGQGSRWWERRRRAVGNGRGGKRTLFHQGGRGSVDPTKVFKGLEAEGDG